jgi:hypothetical protein
VTTTSVGTRNACKILAKEPHEKSVHGRPRHKWKHNIKMNLKKLRSEGKDWTDLAKDKV